MITQAYKAALSVLAKKPFVLWGLSLMSGLLCILAVIFCLPLPIVFIPVSLTLSAGMSIIYLDGLRGKQVNSDQLFLGFKNFWHVAGGMAWMMLWVLIWSLIPFAGIIIGIVKAYSYRFTPYILMTRPEISATEALRVSMRETQGKKGAMFGADIIIALGFLVVVMILALLAQIPILGVLFALLLAIVYIVFIAFGPLFLGLVEAYFYETRNHRPVYYQYPPYGQTPGGAPNGGPYYQQYPPQSAPNGAPNGAQPRPPVAPTPEPKPAAPEPKPAAPEPKPAEAAAKPAAPEPKPAAPETKAEEPKPQEPTETK